MQCHLRGEIGVPLLSFKNPFKVIYILLPFSMIQNIIYYFSLFPTIFLKIAYNVKYS